MKLKLKALLSGLATYIPRYRAMRRTGGTDSARYCYSVWLRHLVLANAASPRLGVPRVVAELGPGDSIGIGLAALLCGAEKYFAFDVVAYPDLRGNLAVFDELVELLRRREPIPGGDEFPSLQPLITDLGFPVTLLDDARLAVGLAPARVAAIRSAIENAGETSCIVYRAPWTDDSVIQNGTIDMIYSQAVLEHVVDLPAVFAAMRRWLKPGGVMSHQIDYRCHGKADTWDGHRTFSDSAWKVVVGRRPYLLNRVPHSEQMRLLRAAGFAVLAETTVRSHPGVTRRHLAARFRDLSEDDRTTSGAFVLAAPVAASE
ncbi:MAG: methyltransferase domain-containing protein [Pseudomonadota bacterium]